MTSTLIWRLLILLLLGLFWLVGDGGTEGIMLLFALAIMALGRWRVSMPGWTTLIDQAACLLVMPVWPAAGYGLALPVFESVKDHKPWYLLPVPIAALAWSPIPPDVAAFLALSAFAGWAIRGWELQVDRYRREADRERGQRYELEHLKKELLQGQIEAVYMAELAERHRIARELHDHTGHELTGLALALQAYEQLRKEGAPEADELFAKARARLADSIRHLRETVHNMIPVKAMGVERMEEIGRQFTACPLELQTSGDASAVPVYVWSILEPCLKEALTNVSRHAKASRVQVSLDISDHIVRLSVHNDGVGEAAGDSGRRTERSGFGLRNLRQRVRAVGGSVSSSVLKDGFLLVCVLPLEGVGVRHENSDR